MTDITDVSVAVTRRIDTSTLDATTQGALYQALLDGDSRPTPDVYRLRAPMAGGPLRVPVERYTSPEFHRIEVEKVWTKVWQMACREEDIPEVGDHITYDIVGISILVVRSAPGTISAFRNVCRHRGRVLKEYAGRDDELRCPFHGFAWNLDGSFKHAPCRWDFEHVDVDDFDLPPVRTGTWGGFVFVNLDPDCGSLDEHLGDLPSQFTDWPLEDRFKQVHVGKILRCNWKVAQEAFMESYHVVATHPQLLPGMGDTISQYDSFGTFARAITPNGLPSTHLKWQPTAQEMVDVHFDRAIGDPAPLPVPDGADPRTVLADHRRRGLADTIGEERAEALSDAEVNDSLVYAVFPNFHPWGSYNRIAYRFRPYGNHHDLCVMECMILSPFSGERPPSSPLRMLGVDDDWTDAYELGLLTRVFNQDVYNLPRVQEGLASGAIDEVVFARYQETKIRAMHAELDRWLAKP
jgi:phenylpropionate dioxygenase-like ring-hydroxylating dioxygenase large terminal subunit